MISPETICQKKIEHVSLQREGQQRRRIVSNARKRENRPFLAAPHKYLSSAQNAPQTAIGGRRATGTRGRNKDPSQKQQLQNEVENEPKDEPKD